VSRCYASATSYVMMILTVQQLLHMIEKAQTLTQLIMAVWPLARVLAQHIVEYVLAERAQRPIVWPPCPTCGTVLRSKGFAQRQLMSLIGPIRWRRCVGRCPHGCDIPQVAPLDAALGVQAHQRTSGELQCLGCALAVLVPFATAARLLGWYCGGVVSPRAVWGWVQAAGRQAMGLLQGDLATVDQGHEPAPEPLTEAQAALPLVLGADGVMVPFRPEGGNPRGKIRWREIKVGVLARLGQHRTRAGQVVPRLQQRRLVAILGDSEALKLRLWCEAVRQGIVNAPTARSLFKCNASTVARPHTVRPMISVPSSLHWKWRFHCWRRGLKSRTHRPVTGSRPCVWSRLARLHSAQASHRFASSLLPPRARGVICSMCNVS
jgi:hypothetical protein